MTEDLLFKEKGFHRLNKELEQKANNLITKIDSVVNTYNNGYLNNSRKHYINVTKEKTAYLNSIEMQNEDDFQVPIKRNSSLPHIFDHSSTLKSKVEPQKHSEDEVSKQKKLANQTVFNFLKGKVDILHNELQTMRVEYKKQVPKIHDLDKLQKQIKITNQQSNNCIMKLNRSLENNDKLKSALKYSEVEEKELKTQIRKLQEDKKLTVTHLGKQLSELIQVFKKQMLIVHNLKKQNACLLAVGQLKLTKEDFSRLLDQKPENL
ncbi:uncharacterized protein LOC122530363 isoform X3 [Frieseomelitta varia]|uniref:uncharacterized protein LOC122530363 isoform X3 n=1 Tax=Frieseomelitta varia TaxID=561572 RepID=UPI001CB68955|nr:uncharacterized protein LOC122530363 isoform X3 [Frieseomelitta varia]